MRLMGASAALASTLAPNSCAAAGASAGFVAATELIGRIGSLISGKLKMALRSAVLARGRATSAPRVPALAVVVSATVLAFAASEWRGGGYVAAGASSGFPARLSPRGRGS